MRRLSRRDGWLLVAACGAMLLWEGAAVGQAGPCPYKPPTLMTCAQCVLSGVSPGACLDCRASYPQGKVDLRDVFESMTMLPAAVVKEIAACHRISHLRTFALEVLRRREKEARNCAADGRRVQLPGGHGIYLMLDGKKRLVPNPRVYNDLFRSWGGIHRAPCVSKIPTGSPLGLNARLCRVGNAVFLDDGQSKRHIASRAVMDRYHLAWNRVGRPCISGRTGPQIR